MPEDLQNTLFQMLQRLEKASTSSRSDIDVVPPRGKRRKNNQPDGMDVIINPACPFPEAPINMLNITWAEKGKGKITREDYKGRRRKTGQETYGENKQTTRVSKGCHNQGDGYMQ
ncbi:hypothetical protein ACFX15_019610 [Malus domestica]